MDRAIQLADPLTGDATGPALQAVPLGSVVVVTVQLTTPDDLGVVTVEALMPGGLEALDPNVATDGKAATGCGSGLDGADASAARSVFWWWWWPPCPAQETRPQVVTLQYQRLAAGSSSVSFKAVAATAGTFVLPPVKAYDASQPELMGLTAGAAFVVCDPAGDDGANCVAAPADAQPPAQPCPADCNGNGVCNLSAGECVCYGGFTGEACDQPTST